MTIPQMPPRTEAIAANVASRKALWGCYNAIGASMMEDGIERVRIRPNLLRTEVWPHADV